LQVKIFEEGVEVKVVGMGGVTVNECGWYGGYF